MPLVNGTTLPASGDVVVASPGTYLVPGALWAPASLTITDPGAILFSDSYQAIRAAGAIALQGGTVMQFLFDGGTIALAGGRIDGIVQDASIRGDLVLDRLRFPFEDYFLPARVEFRNRFDLRAADGIGPGTLTIADTQSALGFVGVATIDNATIVVDLVGEGRTISIEPGGTATTLGPKLMVDILRTGGIGAGGTLVNDGTIRLRAGALAGIAAGAFTGHGTIDLASGARLSISADQSTAHWLEAVAQVTGDGHAVLAGTIENAADVLDLRAGGPLRGLGSPTDTDWANPPLLARGGTLLADGAAPLPLALRDVTVRGTLGLPYLVLAGGTIALQDAAGAGPGTLDIARGTLNAVMFAYADTAPVTLSQGTLRIGGSRGIRDLTVAPGATLAIAGTTVETGFLVTHYTMIANDGRLLAEAGADGTVILRRNAGTLALAPGAVLEAAITDNTGRIEIAAGATLAARFDGVGQGPIAVAAGGTLVMGGALASATLLPRLAALDSQGTLVIAGDLANAGITLPLSALGPHAEIAPGYAVQGGTILADAAIDFAGATLEAVAWRGVLGATTGAGGTITLRRGIDFPQVPSIDLRGGATLLSLDLAVIPGGTVRLGGGGAIAGGVVLGASAMTAVSGSASLGGGAVNQGVIALDPGAVLALAGAANLGTVVVGNGMLVAGAGARGLGTIDFGAGNGTLVIPSLFGQDISGTLAGFAPGDAIVLGGSRLAPGQYGYGAQDGVLTISTADGIARFALAGADMAIDAELAYGPLSISLVVTPTADPPELAPMPLVLAVRNGAGEQVTYAYADEQALQRAAFQASQFVLDPDWVPVTVYQPGSVPTAPGGGTGAVLVVDTPGALTLPEAFHSVVIDAPGQVQLVGNNEWGRCIFAGSGGTVLLAKPADGMFAASGGDNVFFGSTTRTGRWTVLFGNGDDVAVTAAGIDTVITGGGRNTVWLGSGGGYVEAQGSADIVVGGAGAATVGLRGGDDVVFGGAGPLLIQGGTGSSTILGAAGGTTLYGGDGDDVVFGAGPLTWYGGHGTPTLVGGGGAVTAVGGAGGGVFWGGTGGPNSIDVTGDATIVGGGAGDVLRSHGTGTHVIYAGPGAETVSAVNSSGTDLLLAGTGPNLLRAGSGLSLLVAGPGGGTLAGGLGAALFEFINGYGGGAVTVTGFNPAVGRIALVGFGAGAATQALAAGHASAAGFAMALPDGTRLLFQGLDSLPAASFL